MKHEVKTQGRWERVKSLFNMGMFLATTIGMAALAKDRFLSAFTEEGWPQFPIAQLSILLLLESASLIYLWWKAVTGELQMLKDHLTSFIPSIPPSSSIISVGLSFLLGILVYLSNNIVIYSIVFAFFKLLEIWGIWVRDSQIKAAIEEARKEVPGEDESHRSLDIIENYYIKRPQVQLAITILFFSFVSHILGLLSKLVQGENTSKLFLTGAYSVMIIVILINEFVYKLWRRKRDAHLHEYYS